MVLDYNTYMGGVDLVNQNNKNYAITVRLKKWYWSIWTWFLNMQMVQAWRLYRHTWKVRHLEIRKKEEEEDKLLEEKLQAAEGMNRTAKERIRKDVEDKKKKKRKEEKKVEEIPLLNFVRECVEVLLQEHSDLKKSIKNPQRVQDVGRSSTNTRVALRFDHSKAHLVMKTEIKGVCQECHKRSNYRCEICNVALHPDCFRGYHVQ